jgi:hypothetical protein
MDEKLVEAGAKAPTSFSLAEQLMAVLSESSASKKMQKEALGLVASRFNLRVVPVGIPLGSNSSSKKGAGPAKAKGPASKPKDEVNTSPLVVEAQAVLDGLLLQIRTIKSEGGEVPPDLLEAKASALLALKSAKQSFRDGSL